MAGLLKYFTVKHHRKDTDDERMLNGLLDPIGELSKVVPSSSIEVTNEVIHQARENLQRPFVITTTDGSWVLPTSLQNSRSSPSLAAFQIDW